MECGLALQEGALPRYQSHYESLSSLCKSVDSCNALHNMQAIMYVIAILKMNWKKESQKVKHTTNSSAKSVSGTAIQIHSAEAVRANSIPLLIGCGTIGPLHCVYAVAFMGLHTYRPCNVQRLVVRMMDHSLVQEKTSYYRTMSLRWMENNRQKLLNKVINYETELRYIQSTASLYVPYVCMYEQSTNHISFKNRPILMLVFVGCGLATIFFF